jgi:hypothetical protein
VAGLVLKCLKVLPHIFYFIWFVSFQPQGSSSKSKRMSKSTHDMLAEIFKKIGSKENTKEVGTFFFGTVRGMNMLSAKNLILCV